MPFIAKYAKKAEQPRTQVSAWRAMRRVAGQALAMARNKAMATKARRCWKACLKRMRTSWTAS